MAFDANYFREFLSSPSQSLATRGFSYLSVSDDLATIISSGYFNALGSILNVDDVIVCHGTDVSGIFNVTAVSPNVLLDTIINSSSINLPRGNILVGNSSGLSYSLDASSDGNILIGDGNDLNPVAVSGDILIDNAGLTTLQQVVSGTHCANVASDNVIGGVPVVHKLSITGGGTANYDLVMTDKTEITGIQYQFNGSGSASDTIQFFNDGDAITTAFNANQADKDTFWAADIDDLYSTIAAGGTFRCTYTDSAGSDSPPMVVFIHGFRVA